MSGDSEAAPAKVNLYLHVLGRAPGGYHLLDSVAVFGPAFDMLHAFPSDSLSLEVTGPFGAGLSGDDNLVMRAARALADAAGVVPNARLVLNKRLPVASGIGGGSADAAAALRLLSRVWGVALPPAELMRVAAGLGADVPVCVTSAPARMGGVGDVLTAVPGLPDFGMLLVNAGLPVATAEVFRARTGEFSIPAALPGRMDGPALFAWLAETGNDLQPAALTVCPAIADVLDVLRALPGCRLARMSGSGGTCFGLFESAAAAEAAAAAVPEPWWRCGGAPFTANR